MTKPPPPDGYRDWCEWWCKHAHFRGDMATKENWRAWFECLRADLSVRTCALDDYAALRRELDALRAERMQQGMMRKDQPI